MIRRQENWRQYAFKYNFLETMTILIITEAHVGWCLQYALVDVTSQSAYFELLLVWYVYNLYRNYYLMQAE